MSRRRRKERIEDLYSRIAEASKDGILHQKTLWKIKANFILEYGLSEKTFWEYMRQLEHIGFAVQSRIEYDPMEDETDEWKYIYEWKISKGVKLP